MSELPPAPAHEETADACCAECGGLFHRTDEHHAAPAFSLTGVEIVEGDFPPGYDPAEADRLIGRDVPDAQ